MRHLIVVALAVVFWGLMLIVKQHREKIMIGGIVVLSLISGVYCYAKASDILPAKHPFSQTFYNDDYLESGEFPDAFLRLYLDGKTVRVKNDRYSIEEAEESGRNFVYAYYHVDNMVNYLNSVDSEVVEDEALNSFSVPDSCKGDFESLGYINDLLRNTVMYTKQENAAGNYFFFLWYYRDLTDSCYLYVNAESLNEDELVLIWQNRGSEDLETEDIYLMGKSYFEKNIQK